MGIIKKFGDDFLNEAKTIGRTNVRDAQDTVLDAVQVMKNVKDKGSKIFSKEILADIDALIAKMEKFDVSTTVKSKTIVPSGNILTKDEVKEIVEKATGLRFKIAKGNANNASEEYTPELLMSTYGISVDKKNIAVYVLDRNTEDRSSLSYLEVVCIPGNVYYMWGSDRVSGDSEGFMKNTQFAKSLKGI